MSKIADAEANATSLDSLVNDNGLIPTLRNGPKPSYQYLVDGWDGQITSKITELNKSRGFNNKGTFAAGFTYELPNDVGIDASGNPWIYNGTLPFTVTAGTTPSSPTYTQVTYGTAAQVSTNTSDTVQSFVDSFALKIFQSPTDGGLTEIQTRTVNANEVYEVRKTSDDSLATIYSDAASPTEIVQNGIDNVSGGDGVVEFYIADGDYYVDVGGVKSNFKSIIPYDFESELPDTPAMEVNPNLSIPRVGANARRKFASKETIELYVDAGVSVSGDGSDSSPFKTFKEALDQVPINLYHKTRIYIMDGFYNEPFVIDRVFSTASRYGNFEIVGHTPENPRYSDTDPEAVEFSYYIDSTVIEATFSNVTGGQYNTKVRGVTVKAIWPYNASLEIIDCVVVGGGGAFAPIGEGYGASGHGGSVLFTRVKFKDIGGYIAEATDFARFHFDSCEVENWLGSGGGLLAVNGSVISLENSPTIEALGWDVEPGSMIFGDGGIGIKKNVVQTVGSSSGDTPPSLYLAGGAFTNTSATYSSVMELINKDASSNPAGCNLYIGSTEEVKNSRLDIFWSDGSGGASAHNRIGSLNVNGELSLSGSIGLNGATPLRPSVTGSTDTDKINSLIAALDQIGIIRDSTT